jgi:hypothetical protein
LFGSIYRTLEGWDSLPLPKFSFSSSYVRSESCLDFSSNQKREGGR